MKTSTIKIWHGIVAVVCLNTAAAWAQISINVATLTDKDGTLNSFTVYNHNGDGGIEATYGGVYAGPFQFTFNTPSQKPSPDYPTTFETYCIDIYTDINPPGPPFNGTAHTFTPAPITITPWWVSPDSGQKAAYLYNTFKDSVLSTDGGITGGGLQLAIWTVLYGIRAEDPNTHIVTYNHSAVFTFTASTAIQNQTDSYIAQAENASWGGLQYNSTWWQLTTAANNTPVQALIGPALVPEPASVGVAVVAILGLLAVFDVRKKTRQ